MQIAISKEKVLVMNNFRNEVYIMYQTFFGMKTNPFKKDIDIRNSFETNDFKETQRKIKIFSSN